MTESRSNNLVAESNLEHETKYIDNLKVATLQSQLAGLGNRNLSIERMLL